MSSDPISDAAEGATKGLLDWTSDKVQAFINQLKEKKLAFIQEPKTIDIVREQYRSGESKFYGIYIKDQSLLFLTRLGLTLRKLEGDEERLQNLREKIFQKHKVEGLHVAEFVENGILNRYIGIMLEKISSIESFTKDIEDILKNIEKHALFVQGTSSKAEIIKKASIVVNAHSPCIFIIAGIKSAAKIVVKITEELKVILKDYDFEKFSSGEKEILFFKRRIPENKV